ncbi:hypothetical protein ZWY2020_005535, partial [Hordeum vulgare]
RPAFWVADPKTRTSTKRRRGGALPGSMALGGGRRSGANPPTQQREGAPRIEIEIGGVQVLLGFSLNRRLKPTYIRSGPQADYENLYGPPTTHLVATVDDLTDILDYAFEEVE